MNSDEGTLDAGGIVDDERECSACAGAYGAEGMKNRTDLSADYERSNRPCR